MGSKRHQCWYTRSRPHKLHSSKYELVNMTTNFQNNYFQQYLSALLDAIYEDNVNVIAYTVWSVLDNLEWSHGYQYVLQNFPPNKLVRFGFRQKLGLVQVDFDSPDRTRTPKDSYYWYQQVNKNRCLLSNQFECVW